MNTISTQPSIQDSAVRSLGSGPVLVLAAEPGDDIFGCGGACRLHAEAGDDVQVLVVSDGYLDPFDPPTRAVLARKLRSECYEAATRLKCREPLFWDESPSDIQYIEELVLRLMRLVDETGSKLLYAPSPYDSNQTRSAIGLLAREAARRTQTGCTLIFFGLQGPTQPNRLIDITTVFEEKQAAMACLGSLPDVKKRSEQTSMLNRRSALRLPGAATAAEEVAIAEAEDLIRPIGGIMENMTNWTEQRHVGPLVSIVIRTTNRAELADALDSIASQTYRHIEVILVDVEGRGSLPFRPRCGPFPLRIASTGAHLGRGAAANVGMMAAAGRYIAFLDDDDWFLPDHVAGLVEVLEDADEARVAYAGVECRRQIEGENWETVHVFNEPYDRTRLLTQNYLPMHAVLFSRDLLSEHLRFDETLDLYEDWDFWLQLSGHSDFIHHDRITAIYRISPSGGFGVRDDDPKIIEGLSVLFDKWQLRWSTDQIIAITHRANQHLADVEQIADLRRQLAEQDRVFREHLAEHERNFRQHSAEQERNFRQHSAEQERNFRGALAERDSAILQLHSDLHEHAKTINNLQAGLTELSSERLRSDEAATRQRATISRLEARNAAIQSQQILSLIHI